MVEYSRGDGSRVRMLQFQKIAHMNCFLAANGFDAVQGHLTVTVEISSRPTAGDPELTEDQTDRDAQVGELDARVLAPLYSSADRHVRKLVRISKQSLDIAGGVHAGKDDPGLATTASGSDTRVVGLARLWRGS